MHAYRQKHDEDVSEKASDESDELVEQRNWCISKLCLLARCWRRSLKLNRVQFRRWQWSITKTERQGKGKHVSAFTEGSVWMQITELESKDKELQAVNKEINKRRQELKSEIEKNWA